MSKYLCVLAALAIFVAGCDCCGCKPCDKDKPCHEKCEKEKCDK